MVLSRSHFFWILNSSLLNKFIGMKIVSEEIESLNAISVSGRAPNSKASFPKIPRVPHMIDAIQIKIYPYICFIAYFNVFFTLKEISSFIG